MKKPYYQPIVVRHATDFINDLKEINFFEEHEIKNEEYTFNYFCEKLTEKFISGELNDEFEEEIFSDEEFFQILSDAVTGSIVNNLIDEGILFEIEDENNEIMVTLTGFGKKVSEQIRQGEKKHLK